MRSELPRSQFKLLHDNNILQLKRTSYTKQNLCIILTYRFDLNIF